jgi:hypothetical protein
MVRLFLIFVFCISPLLLSTVIVWLGRDSSADYWNTMPYFIMFSVPLCLVTTAIVVAAILVKASSKDATEKRKQES